MSDETLKPCPFCGRADIEVERVGTHRASCIVNCGWCGARRESGAEGPGSPAVTWNERADEARIRAESATERTAAIVAWLRKRFADTDRSAANWFADLIEAAFPKPGGDECR